MVEFISLICYNQIVKNLNLRDRFLEIYAMVMRHGGDLSNTHHQVVGNLLRNQYCAHSKQNLRLCNSISATLKYSNQIRE
jgi:hypothetical protein